MLVLALLVHIIYRAQSTFTTRITMIIIIAVYFCHYNYYHYLLSWISWNYHFTIIVISTSFSSLLAQSCYLNHHDFAAFLWVVGDAWQHQGANRSSEANHPTATWMGWGFLLAGSITCGTKFRTFEHWFRIGNWFWIGQLISNRKLILNWTIDLELEIDFELEHWFRMMCIMLYPYIHFMGVIGRLLHKIGWFDIWFEGAQSDTRG